VESTPGRVYRTVDPNENNQQATSFFDVFRSGNDGDDRSKLGRMIGWLISIRATDPLLILFRFVQLPVSVFLIIFLWRKYLRPNRNDSDPTDVKSRKMLRSVDRKLKRYALIRQPHETIYQFAERIERQDSSAGDSALRNFAHWYRQYANARYQGNVPKPLHEL
jgi:protein-glutamine gamma-glutamyltransferase